jgi:hypothetical protein
MAKQSKITVKHYLEKKVKPQMVYDDLPLGYPLYYRITYKTKTTNLKSFTGAIMTEKAYEDFKNTNKPNAYETNYRASHINLKLENELFFIEKAIEEITKKDENIGVFDEYFIENLKTFFNDLKESLFFQAWLDYEQEIELKSKKINNGKIPKPLTVKQILNQKIIRTKEDIDFENQYKHIDETKRFFLQEQFYYIFNQEKSLIYSLNILKEVTGFDAFPFIHENTLKIWHVIGLILLVYPNTLFIDFFINYNIEKIIKQNKDNKTVTNDEIITICNKLKNNHLGVYFK